MAQPPQAVLHTPVPSQIPPGHGVPWGSGEYWHPPLQTPGFA